MKESKLAQPKRKTSSSRTIRERETAISPSLETLTFFCRLVEAVDERTRAAASGVSLRSIAEEVFKSSVANLSKRLGYLEESLAKQLGYSPRLVERAPGKSVRRISGDGWKFYDQARQFLKQHSGLAGVLRPEPQPAPTINIAAPNHIIVYVLSEAIAKYLKGSKKSSVTDSANLSFKAQEYMGILDSLKKGSVDFGIDFKPPTGRGTEGATLDDFGEKLDLVLLCPPDDPIAQSLCQQPNNSGEPKKVDFSDLKGTKKIYVLQGLLNARDAERLEAIVGKDAISPTSSFDMTVGHVSMGLSLGLLPGYYWALERVRNQGLIFFTPLRDKYVQLCIYSAKEDRDKGGEAKKLMEMLQREMKLLRIRHKPFPDLIHKAFPSDIDELNKYSHHHHVSCTKTGYDYPRWRHSTIYWTKWESDHQEATIRGELTTKDTNEHRVYDLRGTLGKRLFRWIGTERKTQDNRPPDQYAVCFNSGADKKKPFVGTWSGTDECGAPITGAIILSFSALSGGDIQAIMRDSPLRLFLDGKTTD